MFLIYFCSIYQEEKTHMFIDPTKVITECGFCFSNLNIWRQKKRKGNWDLKIVLGKPMIS